MIYITGDCHAEFNKFSMKAFPEQREMTRDDYVIVCGDFGGIWADTNTERYWLKWLAQKRFTLLFVDGNHENFDRLYGDEFPVVDFCGGKAHRIRKNIFHLMRGYVFDLQGYKFFAFGGASSHDIQDGVLNLEDYPTIKDLVKDYNFRTANGEMLRINHISWWKQELPSTDEMERGANNLKAVNNKVDFVISHALPQQIVSCIFNGSEPDAITEYFNELLNDGLDFKQWYCGHYHFEYRIQGKYNILYHSIIRII